MEKNRLYQKRMKIKPIEIKLNLNRVVPIDKQVCQNSFLQVGSSIWSFTLLLTMYGTLWLWSFILDILRHVTGGTPWNVLLKQRKIILKLKGTLFQSKFQYNLDIAKYRGVCTFSCSRKRIAIFYDSILLVNYISLPVLGQARCDQTF